MLIYLMTITKGLVRLGFCSVARITTTTELKYEFYEPAHTIVKISYLLLVRVTKFHMQEWQTQTHVTFLLFFLRRYSAVCSKQKPNALRTYVLKYFVSLVINLFTNVSAMCECIHYQWETCLVVGTASYYFCVLPFCVYVFTFVYIYTVMA